MAQDRRSRNEPSFGHQVDNHVSGGIVLGAVIGVTLGALGGYVLGALLLGAVLMIVGAVLGFMSAASSTLLARARARTGRSRSVTESRYGER